jgi:ATP-dependent DNA helicase RecQ
MNGSGVRTPSLERVARWLRGRGIDAQAYSGESDDEHRLEVEDALASNRVKVVVATSALGMGYDKPDLGFVVHYQSPGSPIAYYQQVGRAGRALATSFGILLTGHEDVDIQDWFIRTAFPPRAKAEEVIELLAASEAPMKLNHILDAVNVRRTRLEAMLKVLEVEGAVERSPEGGWLRTAQPWAYDQARVDDVTAIRRAEQAAMRDYVNAPDCLMQRLRRELDDPEARPCGRCATCTGRRWDIELDRTVVGDAIQFLRSATLIVDPRLAGVPKDEHLEPGRALSVYDDHGWGSQVARGKYQEGAFADELVTASAGLIRGWRMDPSPTWVTSVPSLRHPTLVLDFARRLAHTLDLVFVDAIEKVKETQPQKEMENTAQQRGNVYGAFAVKTDIPDGPVLLVDDMCDSRWTLTVVGGALRRAGSGPVYPFVLATAVGT